MEEESDDFESPDKVPQQTDIGDPIEPPENISPQLEPISTEVGQMVTDAMSNGMDSDHFMDILAEKIKHTIISPEFALQHLERKEFQREWLKIIREEKTGDLSNWSENFRESTLVQTTLSEKFEQYEQEHDKAMHMKFSTELKEEIRLGKIPPEMAEKHLDGEAFQKEYFELILKEASPELKAELGEHEDLEKSLFGHSSVQESLRGKFKDYERAHDEAMEKKFTAELKEKIEQGKIPPEMAEKHLEGEAFQKEYFELILKEASPELKAELGEHEDLRKKLSENSQVKDALGKKFNDYEESHEKSMETRFSIELSKKINKKKISPEDIRKHFSEEQFSKHIFKIVLTDISPLLKEELNEHQNLKMHLFEAELVKGELLKKYENYKTEHAAFEQKTITTGQTEIRGQLAISSEDIDNDNFHNKEAFRKTMLTRIIMVIEKAPEDLRAQLLAYAEDQIVKSHQIWENRHMNYHKQVIREMEGELDQKLVLSEEDIRDNRFHDQGNFREQMGFRCTEVVNNLPEDLRSQTIVLIDRKIATLYEQWHIQHENFHKNTLNNAQEEVDEVLILNPNDEDDDRFHDKGTFEKTMRLRLSSVMVQVPEDLRSGIESYANTQIRSLYQEWKKRHESYHDRILRSARIELSNALVFRREDKEDDRFHHQGKFREALLERTIEIMVKAPEDLRNQLELSTEEKIRELYDKWQKEHETYHVRTLQEARREISRELILTAHDRENEDFENQNLFKQHMRNRVAGIMNRLPDDLKKDMDFYLEEKLEGLYEEWRLEKFILSTREPSRKMEPKEKTEKTVDQLSSLYEAAALVHGKEALDGCFIARRSGSSGGISRHSSTPFFS